MTVHELATARTLLARKGRAAPIGMRTLAEETAASPAANEAPDPTGAAEAAAKPDETSAPAGRGASESGPAASLLPFELARARFRAVDPAAPAATAAPAAAEPAPAAAPTPTPSPAPAQAKAPASSPAPAQSPASPAKKLKPLAPMPTPIEPRDSRWGKVVAAMIVIAVFGAAAWYGGAGERLQQEIFSLRDRLPPWFGPTEAPAAPEPGAALTAPAAQVPPVAAQPASPDRPTSAAGESAAEADRSAFATDDSASEAGQSVSEAEKLASEAERAAAQAEQAATEAKQAASDAKQAASASSGADAATAVAGAGGEAKPPLAAPLDPAALETGAAPDSAEEAARAEDAASAIEGAGGASVDVVRIEPGGEAVIAGRAAPRSELIILDNGTPIGMTTADGFGEWVFVTTSPLPQGAHEFGLVLKAVQGGAKLPAPAGTGEAGDPALAPEADGQSEAAPEPANGTQRGAAPASDSGGGLGEPIPLRKPEPAASRALPQGTSLVATKAPDFVVQLAAVKTRAGAKREWVKLQARFPDILNGMQPVLDENGRGTVVRLRTGAFTDARAAADLCARFEAARQDCLVVRVR